jgi:energy-converting hydrogenase Eha subunit C
MDLLPLIIHYPIAFLTVYSAFEFLRFRKLIEQSQWHYVKGVILIIGELGALASVIVARLPSSTLAHGSDLVEVYKTFMTITALIFGVITVLYLKNRVKPIVVIPLSLIGLFFVVVSGGLFGATVYGTQFDPYLAPVFKILGVY